MSNLLDTIGSLLYEGDDIEIPRVQILCPRCKERKVAARKQKERDMQNGVKPRPIRKMKENVIIFEGMLTPGSRIRLKCPECGDLVSFEARDKQVRV
jgi:ribosomal protein S27AE